MSFVEKIEKYLISMGVTYEKNGEKTWIINDHVHGLANVILALEDPVVIARAVLFPVPEKNNEKFFEKVLKLNGEDLVYVSYGIVGGNLVLTNSLLAETLDLEELHTTFDEIGLAMAQHRDVLLSYK